MRSMKRMRGEIASLVQESSNLDRIPEPAVEHDMARASDSPHIGRNMISVDDQVRAADAAPELWAIVRPSQQRILCHVAKDRLDEC